MSFCFNFSLPAAEEGTGTDVNAASVTASTETTADVPSEPFRELSVTEDHIEELDEYSSAKEVELSTGQVLYIVDAESVEEWIRKHGCINGKKTDLGAALEKNSDLIPQVYEGGLKIWECSLDLIEYLIGLEADGYDFSNKKVLELGCGAGLPGLYTLMKGSQVHFTDYNWEVLDFITIPNVILNTMMDTSNYKLRGDDDDDEGFSSDNSDSSEEDEVDSSQKKDGDSTELLHRDEHNNDPMRESLGKNSSQLEKQRETANECDSEFKMPAVPFKKQKLDNSNRDKNVISGKSGNRTKLKNKSTKSSDISASKGQKTNESVSVRPKEGDQTFEPLFSDLMELQKRCKFYSGDWKDVQKNLLSSIVHDDDKYDVILTSETIYSRDSYDKLLSILQALLKPGGVIYLAAKTYYFGVGGGTRNFEERVAKHGVFHTATCAIHTEGVHREILKMMFK